MHGDKTYCLISVSTLTLTKRKYCKVFQSHFFHKLQESHSDRYT
jgi:hypothetical protein